MPTPFSQRDAESEIEGLSIADGSDERPLERRNGQRYVSYSSVRSSPQAWRTNTCCVVQIVMHALHIFVAAAIILWVHQRYNYLPEKVSYGSPSQSHAAANKEVRVFHL